MALAALVIAFGTACVHAVAARSATEAVSDPAVLTAWGTRSFATDGDLLGESPDRVGDSSAPAGHGSFKVVVGAITGLYPGNRQRLAVRLSNTLPFPIRIRTATTTATGPARCPPATSLLLRRRTFHHLVVGVNRSQAKTLRFGMLKTATDACQNGTFTVTVAVAAVRA